MVQQYGVRLICDFGNDCSDSDLDGICDAEDCCPNHFSPFWNCEDDDNDGVVACEDNCPEIANAGWHDMQFDFDQDGIGNACDDDIDGDGVLNLYDAGEYLAGQYQGAWARAPYAATLGDLPRSPPLPAVATRRARVLPHGLCC